MLDYDGKDSDSRTRMNTVSASILQESQNVKVLQGQILYTNFPVIPDKCITISERMSEKGADVVVAKEFLDVGIVKGKLAMYGIKMPDSVYMVPHG